MQRTYSHTQPGPRDGVAISGDLARLWLEGALASLPREVLETARVCAVPAWFDLPLIVLLTGLDELSAVTHLIQLIAARLVRPDGNGGYVYYPSVRPYLLSAWATPARWRRYIALLETLAQHYLPLVYEQTARLRGAEQAAALAMLDRFYPNLEALWGGAVAIGYHHLIYELVTAMDGYHTRRALWSQKVAWLESGLRACGRLGHEAARAEMLNSLGVAYLRLPDGNSAARIQQALACYKQALAYFLPQTFPLDYAMVQNNLGNAYMHMADPTGRHLPRAIACYEEALRYCLLEVAPLSYAIIHSNLGYAYSELTGGSRAENLRRALVSYREALRVYTLDKAPAAYARLQINMGATQAALFLIARDPQEQADHLRALLACYEAALKVYTCETAPAEFAQIQVDMARAHTLLAGGERVPHVRRAIACYREALRVYTLEAAPQQFAEIWVALGLLYTQESGGWPCGAAEARYLQQAITCYEKALRVYTLEAAPRAYAQVQVYLGMAYAELSADERASDLQQAWLSYQEALKGMTLNRLPPAYAGLHHYLGYVYEHLASLDANAHLLQAIACYEASLAVFTPEAAPRANAHIHSKLNTLYAQLYIPQLSAVEMTQSPQT